MTTQLRPYRLEDRYDLDSHAVFLTGIQALVRLPLMQRALDQQNNLNTAGFISGYRGSPLGAYDQELWRQQKLLDSHDIHFEPGINEDLAATAVWGTQLIDHYRGSANKDGVFSIWYGKGHGVDRSGDVFRQANIQGTARHGGVLALAGDDHSAESSVFAHQTDQIFEAAMMPVLFPSSVVEYLTMGLAGIALSRFSGLWVAMKTITETVESGCTLQVPELPKFLTPGSLAIPPHGLNYDVNLAWPSERTEYERRMIEERAPAAHAFAYANKIDREVLTAAERRLGIVTLGKAHNDLIEALRLLKLTDADLQAAGISIFKVGMSWPLDPRGIKEFAQGMQSLLVIEEKRPQLEKQIKEQFYNWPSTQRPNIVGKRDQDNQVLLPEVFVLTPELVSKALARWLGATEPGSRFAAQVQQRLAASQAQPLASNTQLPVREAFFCSGCPHNRSTKVPTGSIAGAGIGCHIMVMGKGQQTDTFTHMGGEGIHWVGLHRFSKHSHMFQNLGDGTYQHSGILAIRQAVVSKVNLTYKILYNDAVAMTGGQETEGQPTPGDIAAQVLAEGVQQVALVSDDISRYRAGDVPGQVSIHDRSEMEAIQQRFRDISQVTVIIYDQTCAAEKRRRRKRGLLDDPSRRLFINERVCEGCSDCSVQSNCIAIEPLSTNFGEKRRVNQSTCNKDYSCVEGFCPSFVSVIGAELKQPQQTAISTQEQALLAKLTQVTPLSIDQPYAILVAGIGGTGVLTVGALLAMAAHLEGKSASSLDFTGLSQKNGAVVAHVKIAPTEQPVAASRITAGRTDLLIGCDSVAASQHLDKLSNGRTQAVLNTAEVPTARFTIDKGTTIPLVESHNSIVAGLDDNKVKQVPASHLAETLFGDSIAANLFMVGYAYQLGLLPLSEASLLAAVELNAVAVEFNQRAFRWGRLAAQDLDAVLSVANGGISAIAEPTEQPDTLSASVARYSHELAAYQDENYAQQYRDLVNLVEKAERQHLGNQNILALLVAKNLYKLMAYKDEYEVARLYASDDFKRRLASQFDGDYKLKYHLAPPLLSRKDPHTGLPRKRTFGGWLRFGFVGLAKLKFLRGSRLDIFGYTQERRNERRLLAEYQSTVQQLMNQLSAESLDTTSQLLALPEQIKGFGHVKELSIAKYDANRRDLLATLARNPT